MFRQWWNKLFAYWRRQPEPPPPAEPPPSLEQMFDAAPPAPEVAGPSPLNADEAFPTCPSCERPYDPRIRDRMKARKLIQARRDAADIVNDILNGLARLELRHGHKLGASKEARALEELIGCDFYLLNEHFEADALAPGDRFSCFPSMDKETTDDLAEICWPIDQAIVARYVEGVEGFDNYLMQRVRTITPEEARGHAQYFVPKMVRHTYIKIYDNGQWYTEDNIHGLINGRWRFLDRGLGHSTRRGGWILREAPADTPTTREEGHKAISTIISMALSRRYSWHVALGNRPDGPRVLLATNPTGCLQFFKNRAKGEGKKRRDALRHWVTRHMRDTKQAGISYVRDHLRGQTEFNWSDLACEIFVSAFDLEKNEAFKREADLWRSQRKHNSVRVRIKRKIA